MEESQAPSPCVTIELHSPRRGREAGVVVIVPTFRRPDGLRRTLASLEAQTTARPFAVIVVENDAEERAGLDAARPFLTQGNLAGLVLVAHERGNCSAYNAGFRTALAEFPLMDFCLVIDDDEAAAGNWIEDLTATADRLDADLVGGPQMPVFDRPAPSAVMRHPVFSAPYDRTGRVAMLFSSGNVCIRRTVLETMGDPVLDTAFNFTGGGDSDFFSRCERRGFCFGWCAEASVLETVPARRAEFSWLNARSLRNGALSTLVQRRRDGRAATLLKSVGLALASPLRALMLAVRTGSALIGLYPLQIALGRLQGEFGRVGEQYRKPESN